MVYTKMVKLANFMFFYNKGDSKSTIFTFENIIIISETLTYKIHTTCRLIL